MTEMIWLGRGGQGAFTAAKLLGAAYALKDENDYSLAFPSFGPERRGAPVRAFTKLDTRPVLDRSETSKADYIIILDETLYSDQLHSLLKPGGKILINSKRKKGENILAFDGSFLSEALHLPTVNTVMLGAVSSISGVVTVNDLFQAIDTYMPPKIREKNKQAVMDAAGEVFK